jgi:4-amino-4-deoxy-L-arabinose transferase-like glycosyltransferase
MSSIKARTRSVPPLLLPGAIILLGAFLRCAQLNWGQYRRDDAIVLGLAQAALTAHQVPWVGMISTLGIDNGPAQVWLAMLGTLAGPSPFAAEWMIALLNVVGIAACYAFGSSAFGRRVGVIAALLFAVSSWSVLYSRRLWGNDMTAPFAALWLWSFARIMRHDDRMHQVLVFVWAALLAQVYVVGIAELPAIVLGLVAAALMRRLRLTPAALGLLVFLAMTGPYAVQTVIPELSSLHRLTSGQHAIMDSTSLRYLAETVGLDAYQWYLPQLSRLLDIGANPLRLVSMLAALLLAAGAVVAVWTIGTGRDAAQRILLGVVLVWVAVPVAATARHAVALFPHYELGTAPATYILMALALAWPLARPWTRWAALVALLAVVAGQVAAATTFLHDVPNYVRGTQYGLPLADVTTLGAAAQQAVRQAGAAGISVVGHDDGAEMGQALQTWAPNVTIIDDQGSLRIGSGNERLVFLTTGDDSPLVGFLRRTAPSEEFRFRGDDTAFRLFTVTATELRTAAATQMPATTPVTLGGDVTLQGAALATPVRAGDPLLWASRWSVTAAGASDRPVASIFVHLLTEQGAKVGAHDQAFDNHATLWQAGDEILSWVTVPIDATATGGTDVAKGGLYQLGPGNSISPLSGPAGPQLDLGHVQIVSAAGAAPTATAGH